MRELSIELLGNFAWALLGIAAVYTYRLVFSIRPTKRLWRLKESKKLVICVSTSTWIETEKYSYSAVPATGIGQVRALALIVTSLNKVYKNLNLRDVLLSEEKIQTKIENDVILLGGPENNKITREFLDEIQRLSIVDQANQVITWKVGENEERFMPYIENGEIKRDYGLIIRMENPLSSLKRAIFLFSGTTTWGTIAAARFFTEKMYKSAIGGLKIRKNLALIVSCKVKDGWPIGLSLERKHFF